MRPLRLWKSLLGLRRTVIEAVWLEDDGETLVVSVRPRAGERDRCPHCRRRCPGYDQGEGRRRWRALDLGTSYCYLEAWAPRVRCRRHGVIVAAVPWARHDANFTRSFEDQTAWLAVNTSKTAVSELMRIAWRSVGWICERVAAEAQAQRDLLAGLSRLGFDEISIRKGQRYLTVVVDHDTGRLVWAHPGRDRKTTEKFLDLLGEERLAQIELVSCDDAEWSPNQSPSAARTRSSAWTRSTSSKPRATRWTRSAARSGTRPAAPVRPTRQGPQGRPVRALEEPRATSPSANSSSSRGSRSSTTALPRLPAHPAATPDLPRRRRARTRAARSLDEVGAGVPARAIRQARPPITEQHQRSRPRSRTSPPTPPSSRSTPRSGSSPDAGSATTHPTPSSPWPSSPSPASPTLPGR